MLNPLFFIFFPRSPFLLEVSLSTEERALLQSLEKLNSKISKKKKNTTATTHPSSSSKTYGTIGGGGGGDDDDNGFDASQQQQQQQQQQPRRELSAAQKEEMRRREEILKRSVPDAQFALLAMEEASKKAKQKKPAWAARKPSNEGYAQKYVGRS